jgi:type I restriction enzyme S subunit
VSQLPQGWNECALEDCLEILDSLRKPINNNERQSRIDGLDQSELYPYYGATGQVGFIDGYLFDGELVALGEDGVPFLDPFKSKAYMLNGKTWVNNHAHVVNGFSGINNRYICYFLNQFDYHDYVNGATRLKLTQTNMRRLPIKLAPSREQSRIANKLDSLLAKVQDTQTRLEKIPGILKRFHQSVLAAATSGELTKEWREGKSYDEKGFPSEWSYSKFSDIGELARGKSKHRPRNDPQLFDGPYPFIQTGEVAQSDGFIKSHKKTYNEFGLTQSRLFPEGTLCITIAANIANTAILTYPACFPDSVVGFIAEENTADAIFIKYLVDTFKDDLELLAPATAQKNINLSILNSLQLPLPTYEEQKEIVRQVESLFALADKVEKQYQTAKQRTDRLTQSLLAKAFRGELVPQDPNDESASALLKRIQAEREALEKTKPKKKRPVTKITGKNVTKKKSMNKTRKSPEVKDKPYLTSILQGLQSVNDAKTLFSFSDLAVHDFYKQLAWEIDQGFIKATDELIEAA